MFHILPHWVAITELLYVLVFTDHVNGYVEFNDEPFDSSRLRGRPEVHKIGLSCSVFSDDQCMEDSTNRPTFILKPFLP